MSYASAIKAGEAFVEITTKDGKLVSGLKSAQKKLNGFSSSVTNVGKKMMVIGGAAAAPLLAGLKIFSSYGDQMDKMAGRTGVAVEALSEYAFAAQQSGSNIEAVERSIKFMQKTVADATNNLKAGADALALVGMTADDLKGLTPEQQFEKLADAVARIKDPTMRANAAMKLFGKAGTELLPMLGNIRALRQEAQRLGLTMSTADAKAAADLTDAWGRLNSTIKMLFFNIGAALAPAMQKLLDRAKIIVIAINNWIKKNRQTVVTIAKVVLGVIAAGAALVAFGAIIKGIALVIGALATVVGVLHTVFTVLLVTVKAAVAIIGFLCTPLGLVVAAIAAMTAGLLYATGAVGKVMATLSEKFQQLKTIALAAFQGIKDALVAGDLALAAKILWLSLKVAFLEGIQPLKLLWIQFKSFFRDMWTVAVYGVLKTFNNACFILEGAWIGLTAGISLAWTALWGGIKKVFNSTVGFLMKKWIQLKGFFDSDIDVEAEISKIDAETADKNSRIDNETSQEWQAQKDRVREQEDRWKKSNGAIDQARDDEMGENLQEYNDELKKSQGDIAQARKEWQEALDEARRKRESKEKEDAAQQGANNAGPVLSGMADKTAKALSGSFYADALARVSGGSIASVEERTATGVEKLVQQSRKTNDLLKKNGKTKFR